MNFWSSLFTILNTRKYMINKFTLELFLSYHTITTGLPVSINIQVKKSIPYKCLPISAVFVRFWNTLNSFISSSIINPDPLAKPPFLTLSWHFPLQFPFLDPSISKDPAIQFQSWMVITMSNPSSYHMTQ